MAKQNKQPTERESRRNMTLSTLESILIQNTLGANLASDVTQYGLMGKNASKGTFDNKEIKEAKEEHYKNLSKQYESLGVAGEPTYPSNSDISYKIISGLENVMKTSYLEDLAEGVNKFIPGLDFKLPEKLNEDEQTAFGVYTKLREAYRLTAAQKIINSNYLGDIKQYLSGVMEKYNPAPKKEGEGK